jgi:hypothetical protein
MSKIIELFLLVVIYYALIFVDLGLTLNQQIFTMGIIALITIASERIEKKLDNIERKLDDFSKNK